MMNEAPSFVELSVASPGSKKNHYSAAERRMHREEWHRSGLSMQEYCRRSGILISIFSQWVKKFKTHKMPGDIEGSSSNDSHPIEVVLVSGIRVKFSGSNLARVLRFIRSLESCS